MSGGDIYGTVEENSLISHKIMVSPKAAGTITHIAREGDYKIDVRRLYHGCHNNNFIQGFMYRQDVILETELNGVKTKHTMMQVTLSDENPI